MELDLIWWIEEAGRYNGTPLQIVHLNLTVETAASGLGWNTCCQGVWTGGRWTPLEKQKHTNYLELLVVVVALRSFLYIEQEEIDHSPTDRQCDSNHFSEHNGWYPLSGALTFSSENLGVVHREGDRYSIRTPPWQRECQSGDWESQHMRDSSDWMLERASFLQLESSLGLFSIDLLASQTNAQLPVYCSWRLDPAAWPWMPCPYLGRIITHMCSHHSP